MDDDKLDESRHTDSSLPVARKNAAAIERPKSPKSSLDASPTISLDTKAQRLVLANDESHGEQHEHQLRSVDNPGVLAARDDAPAYVLKEKIGEGAMGTIYRAESMSAPGSVAVKLLKTSLLGDEGALRRFEKEAQAISQMTHPNIVQIYGVSSQEDDPYIVMEYVEGGSLADILQPGRTVSPSRVTEWMLQICSAMKHAHDKGIIHRDIKPSNILVSSTAQGEELKLVDFGIAKLTSGSGKLTELTQKGEVIGSPNYMSPEQCAGKPVDARSDIYALGCVIYEALSGKTLFVADNSIQVLVQHISSPVTKQLKDLQLSGVSPSLISVLTKMLEKDPDKRYQDAESVLREFQRIKAGRRSEVSQLKIRNGAVAVALFFWLIIATAWLLASNAFNNANSKVNSEVGERVHLLRAPASVFSSSAAAFNSMVKNQIGLISNPQGVLDRYIKISNDYQDWLRTPTIKQLNERQEARRLLTASGKQAEVELLAMGTAAIPTLLTNLQTNEVRDICSRTIIELGPVAVDPVIDWLRNHPSDARRIGGVLTRIGKPAGDKLAFLTTGTESDRRMSAAILANPFQMPDDVHIRLRTYNRYRTESKFLSSGSQKYLIEALSKTTDVTTRKNLLEALQNIQEPTSATSMLVEKILREDRDEDTRMAAVGTLSQWLSDASVTGSEPFLSSLTGALTTDPSWEVRKAAALGLGQYKNPTSKLIRQVRKAKQDSVNSVRQAALMALSNFAVHNQDAMPDLIEALKEQDRVTIENALQAVSEAGVKAAPAVPAVLALDETRFHGLRVMNALNETRSDSPEVVKRMLTALESPSGSTVYFDRLPAVQYFLRQTPATTAAAVPALKRIADEGQVDSNDAKRVLKQLHITPKE